jgi:putative SOS response-associated peptidase YedK
MCGRFVYKGQWETLQSEFPELGETSSFRPNYNAAPTQDVPALVRENGVLKLEAMRWGLIPFWARDAAIGERMINARAETVAEKPSFKGLLKRRRCLIPADGFYEWIREGKSKVPYFIHLRDQAVFGMAGVWDEWKDPAGTVVRSCTIITTQANAFMRPMHHRMPVILARGDWGRWLDGSESNPGALQDLLKPFPDDAMACHPVSPRVNSPAFNSPVNIEKRG